MTFFLSLAQTRCDGYSFRLANRKEQLLWLQVINRAAMSVGDKGTESFRMKDADEITPQSLAADLLT